MIRIGPRMQEVAYFVRNNPGLAMVHAAKYAAPHKYGRVGLQFGYRSVHRALEAGLVLGQQGPRASTLLYPTVPCPTPSAPCPTSSDQTCGTTSTTGKSHSIALDTPRNMG
jgi:hypothetical protein